MLTIKDLLARFITGRQAFLRDNKESELALKAGKFNEYIISKSSRAQADGRSSNNPSPIDNQAGSSNTTTTAVPTGDNQGKT